jgi:hypothetical protein
MPDHLHMIVTPVEHRGADLGNCTAALKRWIRQNLCHVDVAAGML